MFNSALLKLRFKHSLDSWTGRAHGQELLYAHMLGDALRGQAIKLPHLYPTGAAANYSLLYLLLRIQTELPVQTTLEIGIGQSTLLLDALGAVGESVEHDQKWAEVIAGQVTNRTIRVPRLVERHFAGRATMCYDFSPQEADFVIVDGPQGTGRFSRLGALELLDKSLAEEFIVIFDDAERRGEQDTIMEFLKRRNANVHFFSGLKSQCVAYTEKYELVSWF